MQVFTFKRIDSVQCGARNGDHIRVHATAPSAVALAMHPAGFPATDEVALSEVELLAPVPRPGKVICIGLNYRAHAAEGGFAIPSYPEVFLRVTTSLIGPGQPVLLPSCSEKLDWEAELAVVIGRNSKVSGVADPLALIAGYCCFNDVSVRDYQRKTSQWTMGKNFDGTGVFGADLVSADALPPGGSGLRIQSRLNGDTMQDSTTADLIFDVPTLISTLAEVMTLEPGDVIATGTPSGVGHARKPPLFMKEGDRIEVEIEGIGTASNVVARRDAQA